jgi:hypothetical protein
MPIHSSIFKHRGDEPEVTYVFLSESNPQSRPSLILILALSAGKKCQNNVKKSPLSKWVCNIFVRYSRPVCQLNYAVFITSLVIRRHSIILTFQFAINVQFLPDEWFSSLLMIRVMTHGLLHNEAIIKSYMSYYNTEVTRQS